MSSERVGFIGLGRMGRGMAGNLLAAGVDLTVHDVHRDAVEALSARSARAAHSPAELAGQVDRLFLCLPYAPEVREVMFGERGIAAGARQGLAVVDTTTLLHSAALAIGAEAEGKGLGYSDCPVSGMPMRADDGTLTVMFGGSDVQFEAARPYLEIVGETVIHCGPLGAGQIMKAINNVIYDINIVALCEVLPLAVKAGLDPDKLAAVVTSGSSKSFASDYFVSRILEGRFDSDFPMASAFKDIINIQELATQHRAMIPVVNAMTAIYQSAMAMELGEQPKSAMIKVYERVLGQDVRRPK